MKTIWKKYRSLGWKKQVVIGGVAIAAVLMLFVAVWNNVISSLV